MRKITPEKNHILLEKLAEYVMNEVSRKMEVEAFKDFVINEITWIHQQLEEKADKKEIRLLFNDFSIYGCRRN